ncbi:porin family protein [Neolewinella lacunae]|uniref:PorT family protein n=1 Tax=Neolewinella lacunae TaxID=1517758 RepID=A0A923PQ01_9BACT|nr:porin family protein [Neolewinella lacunae]MBC6995344.1 PorT family protein [Neolewinella lacunae]MDN3633056.1 porin family protein [Neolewinella lacunae]
MQSINFRHRVHLYGRKVVLTLLLVGGLCTCVSAQFTGGDNYNFYDFQAKPFYFGLTLGFNSSRYTPFRSEEFLFSDTIVSVKSLNGPGFNLNMIANLKIGQYFDFRFTPGFSFAERRLNYDLNARSNREIEESIQSVFVELPFLFRYKSAPYRDKRLFLIAGVKYSFDVASESRAKQAESLVRISPHDFHLEYGAGIQIFFDYFIFSPEFKISQGIGNTLLFNPNLPQSTVLDKVLSRTFTLSFHIEG